VPVVGLGVTGCNVVGLLEGGEVGWDVTGCNVVGLLEGGEVGWDVTGCIVVVYYIQKSIKRK
jgi:hypothetical protein